MRFGNCLSIGLSVVVLLGCGDDTAVKTKIDGEYELIEASCNDSLAVQKASSVRKLSSSSSSEPELALKIGGGNLTFVSGNSECRITLSYKIKSDKDSILYISGGGVKAEGTSALCSAAKSASEKSVKKGDNLATKYTYSDPILTIENPNSSAGCLAFRKVDSKAPASSDGKSATLPAEFSSWKGSYSIGYSRNGCQELTNASVSSNYPSSVLRWGGMTIGTSTITMNVRNDSHGSGAYGCTMDIEYPVINPVTSTTINYAAPEVRDADGDYGNRYGHCAEEVKRVQAHLNSKSWSKYKFTSTALEITDPINGDCLRLTKLN